MGTAGMLLVGGLVTVAVIAWVFNVVVEWSIREGTRQFVSSAMGLGTGVFFAFVFLGAEVVVAAAGAPEIVVAVIGAISLSEFVEVTPVLFVGMVFVVLVVATVARDRPHLEDRR